MKHSSPGAVAVVAALASSVSDLRRFASRILQAAGLRSKPEKKSEQNVLPKSNRSLKQKEVEMSNKLFQTILVRDI